ncbi:MAG: DNA-directed RNA polymerase subunit beta' [bacterium]|nr:DNA-directed RNA polymerase subunit beta' [bacterium]
MNQKDSFNNVLDFKGLKISLASPGEIRDWSYGEVTKPETINYRTLKPEKDGLFDERIFGPTKDWECYCGKYKRIRYRGIICDKCGVEVTHSRVRRERMGHITLAAPVAHVWFFKGVPSKLSLLLDITPRNLEAVIYFAQYLVVKIDEEKRKKALDSLAEKFKERKETLTGQVRETLKKLAEEEKGEIKALKAKIKNKEQQELTLAELTLKSRQKKQGLEENLARETEKVEEIFARIKEKIAGFKKHSVLTEDEYFALQEYAADDFFTAGMGSEVILEAVKEIDLAKLSQDLRNEVHKTTGQRHIKATKRLRLVEGLRKAGISSEWMVLTILPVLPPDLRPMVQLTGGRFATSDLNDLYRRVINRNNRLKHLIDLGSPEIILRNEKRMLQEAVDSLIDATQHSSRWAAGAQLRSLSDMLRGKQGRFRQNLLGKRVDYSGRSVIVVNPELDLDHCGLPKEMALEMFKPFVLREIITRGFAPNVKAAKRFLEKKPPEVFDILEEITKNHPVLLNRAPTLHRLGIQAFYPVLIEGNAIAIHPCVCTGYNADFDGDQMAVHIPLSSLSQNEAKTMMFPKHNLLKPGDGSPVVVPNKEMAVGCYYLTTMAGEAAKTVFVDFEETILAYQSQKIDLRQPIKVKRGKDILETTVGRILLNEVLPENLRFINEEIKAGTIKSLITKALRIYSFEEVGEMIDKIKELGFWAVTISGVSVSVFDCTIIPEKEKLIAEADGEAEKIEETFRSGLITLEEKNRLINEVWINTTEKITDLTWAAYSPTNTTRMIIDSGGTRASRDQLKQLSAIRGLVVDPLGNIVPLPTKSSFREGLSIFEYVTSARGSRKGLTDSALKTADAGYLTRRLVDVASGAIIRVLDCGTKEGIEILRHDRRRASFGEKIMGRYALQRISDPKTKKVLVKEGEEISEEKLELLEKAKVEKVAVRSALTCQLRYGVCVACYGRDLGTRKPVEMGTPVGVIAAQSIGEPGTQLTLRVRHTGGVVGLDVTQGLPRVEELFEARMPKMLSPISEISGKVEIIDTDDGRKVRIRNVGIKPVEEREYLVPLTAELKVKDDDWISSGTQLASGFLDIKEVLEVRGLRAAQRYLIDETQNVYETQGIPINDKHFEVIVREMSSKVRVESSGDTILLPGELVDKVIFEEENAKILAEGGEPATAQVVVLGITRASLCTNSWLSAASFQETTNVLTDASVAGKEDKLLGLKENVIIGRLIPVTPERSQVEE